MAAGKPRVSRSTGAHAWLVGCHVGWVRDAFEGKHGAMAPDICSVAPARRLPHTTTNNETSCGERRRRLLQQGGAGDRQRDTDASGGMGCTCCACTAADEPGSSVHGSRADPGNTEANALRAQQRVSAWLCASVRPRKRVAEPRRSHASEARSPQLGRSTWSSPAGR